MEFRSTALARLARLVSVMWTYRQSTGELSRDGVPAGTCYSGYEGGKNNPLMQSVGNTGPAPQGRYSIGAPQCVESPGPHGPFILPLTPDPANTMFGRSGFLIHGDSIGRPGFASRGCIIAGRLIREAIAASGDSGLTVIE
jgi:type VI secretion system (T6SS) effector TldE1-like protein